MEMFQLKMTLLIGTIFLVLLSLQCNFAMDIKKEMSLTDKQKLAFNRFKDAALAIISTGYMREDLVLMKYFRYCELNDVKATKMLKDNLDWRSEAEFETMAPIEITKYKKLYPYSTFNDKLGRSVFFIAGNHWNMAAATSSPGLTEKFTKFAYYMMEEAYVKGVSGYENRTASGIVVIDDVHNAQLPKTFCPDCLRLLNNIVNQTESRWPGGLQMAYLLNAPTLLNPTLGLLKGALPKKLQGSVYSYDEDDSEWLPELLKFLEPTTLPAGLYVKSQGGAGGSSGSDSETDFLEFPPAEQGGRGVKNRKKNKKQKKSDDDG